MPSASRSRLSARNDTINQLIEFVGDGALQQSQNEYSAFVQDKWNINRRLTFDLGLRFDRDQIGGRNNFAPRFGFAFLPTDSERTVVRGGVGLFYDKIPLNIGAFEQYQSQRVTTFAPDGITVLDGPRLFRNTSPSVGIKNPYSVAANVQVDHQLTTRLLLRVGYEERHTRRDFFVEPVSFAPDSGEGALLLQNTGRSRYREFQTLARLRLPGRTQHLPIVCAF